VTFIYCRAHGSLLHAFKAVYVVIFRQQQNNSFPLTASTLLIDELPPLCAFLTS
jgi:hypothetical protein